MDFWYCAYKYYSTYYTHLLSVSEPFVTCGITMGIPFTGTHTVTEASSWHHGQHRHLCRKWWTSSNSNNIHCRFWPLQFPVRMLLSPLTSSVSPVRCYCHLWPLHFPQSGCCAVWFAWKCFDCVPSIFTDTSNVFWVTADWFTNHTVFLFWSCVCRMLGDGKQRETYTVVFNNCAGGLGV